MSEEHHPGSGVAEEGAVLAALAPAEAAAIRQGMLQRKRAVKSLREGQGQLDAAAQSGQLRTAREVLAGRNERGTQPVQVIGYVTSGAPRGLVCISFWHHTFSQPCLSPEMPLAEAGYWHTLCMLEVLFVLAVQSCLLHPVPLSDCLWS